MRLSKAVLFTLVLKSSVHLRAHIIVTFAKRSPRKNTLSIAAGAVGKLMGRWRSLRRKHIEDDMAEGKKKVPIPLAHLDLQSYLTICRKLKNYTPCCKWGHDTPSDTVSEDVCQQKRVLPKEERSKRLVLKDGCRLETELESMEQWAINSIKLLSLGK